MRFDLYKLPHKALRQLLGDAAAQAARTDFADREQSAALARAVCDVLEVYEVHARLEDLFVMPLVSKASRAIAAKLEAAHAEQDDVLRSLQQQLGLAVTGGAREGHAFLLQLSRFHATQLVHMADEEELAMPALWRSFEDATLLSAQAALLASMSAEQRAQFGKWMLGAVNAPERELILRAA